MTTAHQRSQLREQNRALVAAIEHGSAMIEGAMHDLVKVRTAVAATSGGTSAALITSQMSDWQTMRATFAAMIAASEALMNSQLGASNAND